MKMKAKKIAPVKIKYFSRDSRSVPEKKAQEYGEELSRIKEQRDKLTADIVLEEASTDSSPLHDYFEWDDAKAGVRWRHQQALNLIGNIVEVVVVEGKETMQRSFYGLQSGDGESRGGTFYVSLQEAVEEESYRVRLLGEIIGHLENTVVLMKMFKNAGKS